ncbi:oligosaccharide flippase family protein [Enterococcus mundtii]|uniref:oligosaccharide flippase family protein n=1 Tax=Enterococcus TaxID=1350 RepID=UPI002304A408|nr:MULTISPECIES: oligosaccharide flippase family protein [Enterococcus]MDA9428595.1 Membrane protein involved in the export of O-antigen, teichoic acid lipoteichoic acid [Enterococcus mundtii 1A]MDK4210717.1 oligosaccharide flippase family protein [Enterococcus mundtii]MDO7878028.1 oligosaccharide flippase family protein [Enterococcus mundtii]
MKNIARNFIYQSIFQIMKIVIPIITIPIVSMALGPAGIGIFNYTNSIAQYFVLVASLGVAMYGNREIALAYNRQEDISKLFWEIVVFKAILTLAVFFIYIAVVSFLPNSNYFYFQSLTILAVLFDISWFFMGIEDFKLTSVSSLFVQIITFVLILLFIKDSNDVGIYILIQTAGIFVSQVLVWFFIKPYITFQKINLKKSFSHIKGSFEFFIPQVAITLYTNLNKTLLGLFIGASAVGFYTNSLTLNTVFITIITTLDIVLLPHMSGLFAKKNVERIVELMDKTIDLQLFFSLPIMFGMLTVYDKLVPWFFGEKFLFINNVIPFFTPLIVIIPLGMAVSRQYLIPIGKVREYNKSVIIGAGINIISNLILLPTVGFFGVVISNLLAEFFVTAVRVRSFLKSTNFSFNFRRISIYFISALAMMMITRILTNSMQASLITNIVQGLIAITLYFIFTVVMRTNPIVSFIQERRSK